MAIFDSRQIEKRRERASVAFGSDSPLILIAAGKPITKPGGADQTYPFLPHPNYYWLTGIRRWGGVLVYDPSEGWTDFVRPVDADERLWEGDSEPVDGIDVKHFADWVKPRSNRPVALLGAPIPEVAGNAALGKEMRQRLDAIRRVKDAGELELFDRAVLATAAGFAKAREVIRPGATEREIQIEIEAEMFRHGADGLGYDSIVGVGSRAAILHSTPGSTSAGDNDLVLIDAGGSLLGYTADVTRTYPAGNRFTTEQQAIYDIVLAAELAAIAHCQHGVEWHDVHRTAARELAAGLAHLGILRIGVDEALAGEAIALFFPHGIGHMVGLGVRDVGGRLPGGDENQKCCGARVRVDLPIQAGFLMTVEPGLYFVPALVDDRERRDRFRKAVDWGELDRWRRVGGVRIEDNVLVTDGAPRVYTDMIPK